MEAIENGETTEELTGGDLSYALDNTVPTVSKKDLEEIERYRSGKMQSEEEYVPRDTEVPGYS